MRRAQNWMAVTLILFSGIVLTACTADRQDTVPTPIPTVAEPATQSSTPSAEPEPDPTMLPGGSALANRAYFDFVNNRLLAVNGNPSDVAITNNLVDAGFLKADLEITADKTSELRQPADSIEFSVHVRGDCLIGQFSAGEYFSTVGPVLSGGRCLVGKTERIP